MRDRGDVMQAVDAAVSCADWNNASNCAQNGLNNAANNLNEGNNLWGLVRRLADT